MGSLTHKRLEENLEILKNERDQDGKPFHVVRVTLPPLITYKVTPKDSVYDVLKDLKMQDGTVIDGKSDIEIVIAASYLNFVITNGLVLISKYYKEGRSKLFLETDTKAKEIFEKYFPTRKVVQIDTEVINIGGGGMHCITQQEPAV